jgi:hypothetical protein
MMVAEQRAPIPEELDRSVRRMLREIPLASCLPIVRPHFAGHRGPGVYARMGYPCSVERGRAIA